MHKILPVLLILCTSCGWHLASNYDQNSAQTLSIPYAYGDGDGMLTNELIAQVQKETSFDYVQGTGAYTLKVQLLDTKSENIGFRYDPHKLHNGKKRIIPDEVRRKLLAKVSLVHSASGKEVIGPAYLMGSCEFDHRYYNLSHNINRYSLGQLTDIDTTYDVVNIPLYRDLARQIAYWLENNSASIR